VTERELRALAAYVEFPEERNLAPSVRARLTARPQRRRRTLVAALAALVLALAVALAVPPARSAILRFLHLQGVTIERVERLPEVKTSGALDLGKPLTLAEARRTIHFRPLTSPLLGEPDRVTWDGHQLWFVYGHTRLLVSQFLATGVPVYIKKVAEPGTTITPVVVNGGMGFFLSGARHFIYMAPSRIIHDERVRLARDVLLWEHGPLTLRLEGELTLAQALRIARTFRQ
jgi:hypothetical protein